MGSVGPFLPRILRYAGNNKNAAPILPYLGSVQIVCPPSALSKAVFWTAMNGLNGIQSHHKIIIKLTVTSGNCIFFSRALNSIPSYFCSRCVHTAKSWEWRGTYKQPFHKRDVLQETTLFFIQGALISSSLTIYPLSYVSLSLWLTAPPWHVCNDQCPSDNVLQ